MYFQMKVSSEEATPTLSTICMINAFSEDQNDNTPVLLYPAQMFWLHLQRHHQPLFNQLRIHSYQRQKPGRRQNTSSVTGEGLKKNTTSHNAAAAAAAANRVETSAQNIAVKQTSMTLLRMWCLVSQDVKT